ncbi:Hypothetical protein CINCED_3A013196 [Cinara cedri]|uniref:Uncharacterized protein n=1 Tax=Cinara cedri TaxID=506608 RepID=A0A5E4MFW3_9HEMI|nr:Hypothetical protein CINCED_3A013196 [Cinara cedri]
MFKYTILFAALAVSASLANSIPVASQEPSPAESNIVVHKKIVFKPQNPVPVSETNVEAVPEQSYDAASLVDTGLSGLHHLISGPKKIVGAVASYVFSTLKSMDAKKIFKIVLLGALVTVLGSVAAVAVAGLVSIISGICAVLPYVRFFFGGEFAQLSEAHVDTLSDFVLGAFDKYENLIQHHNKA